MNILFYRYGSICENDIIDAFNEMGHSIDQITEEITDKNIRPEQCLKLISDRLFNKAYSFVFSINYFPVISQVCNIFKIPYLSWIVDSPVLELYSDTLSNPWNRVFLFDRALYNDFSPRNPDCIFHLPLATNSRRNMQTINAASPADNSRFASDISFVGSLYTEKCPYDKLTNPSPYLSGYLEGLIEAQLKVYGCYFIDESLTDDIVREFQSALPGCYTFPENTTGDDTALVSQLYIGNKITSLERIRLFNYLSGKFNIDIYTASDTSVIPGINNKGTAKTLTEMPLIFHNSKINLNITSKPIRSALPLRTWDIMGCGGFEITNYQTELPEHFVIGEDIESYSSFEELEDKCRYYLEHEQKRQDIAQSGFEKINKYHTYIIRLTQMLELAFNN